MTDRFAAEIYGPQIPDDRPILVRLARGGWRARDTLRSLAEENAVVRRGAKVPDAVYLVGVVTKIHKC